MSRAVSASLLVASLLLACAARPPVVTSSAPVRPHVEVRVYRELPDGASALWGTLPRAVDAPASAPPEGTWFVEPSAPVRTEDEARALATLLREQGVRRLSFAGAALPAPALLERAVEGTEVTALYLAGTKVGDAGLVALPPSLTVLYAPRTRITDAGVDVLLRMPSLRQVDLRGTSVSAEGRTRLERAGGIELVRERG